MRRKDKEIFGRENIERVIRQASYGVLGLVDGRKPYVVPLNFGYSDQIFYFHSAVNGRKIKTIRKNGLGCISLVAHAAVKKARIACGWGTAYVSVFVEGRIREITGAAEKIKALRIIMQQYSRKKKWDFSAAMIDAVRVYCLKTTTLTCKRSGE